MTADVEALIQTFGNIFQRAPTVISEAPGRVNLIGEHTDYNQGLVLPLAVDRTVAVAAAPSGNMRVRVHSLDFDGCDEFDLRTAERVPGKSWANYIRGVVFALQQKGHDLSGADLAISGDVPQGAGLSSSAAFEVAVAGGLCAISGMEIEPREIALICQTAENEFVGVDCGIMDQFAAVFGKAGRALLIDCRSLEVEAVALPTEMAIVVVDSGVPRRLEETAYNRRREESGEAAEALGVVSLRDAGEALLESRGPLLPDHLHRRARHVVLENARVQAAVQALRAGDLDTLGALMYASHASLRDDFEVSIAELDLLVDLARQAEGVLGARLTGAGFGGCTINLVRQDDVEAFRASVLSPYLERTGLPAKMHICRAVDGLRVAYV